MSPLSDSVTGSYDMLLYLAYCPQDEYVAYSLVSLKNLFAANNRKVSLIDRVLKYSYIVRLLYNKESGASGTAALQSIWKNLS